MPKLSNKKHKRKNTKRSNGKISAQAALDYLVSWGWVLIIIVLAIVVLFSLGIFKVPTAPTIINGFQGITMQAAEANSTMMVFKITNSYNQFVNITGVTVDVNNNNYTSYSCLNSLISTGQSTLCRVLVSIPTSSYISKIMIAFTPYKSNIYEVSNGTVSSALVSGSLPINNQLTYFVERGLPYGSTFTVNYNTSTNSTSVSSTNNKVSFNLPFGNYYFSIPSVSYQGCNSIPTPVSGYHSTGAADLISFRSNCTTTFTESGLPSNQQWQVTFNGTTASNLTGSKIYISTENISNGQDSYTATAKSNNLVCVSYYKPTISLGSSYNFNSWNCTTTFTESGLPSNQQWHSNYDGLSPSASTGSPSIVTQTGITTVSQYTAEGDSNDLSCNSYNAPSISEGSSYAFSSWNCTTTFTESGLPSNQQWHSNYDGLSPSASTGSPSIVTQTGITTVSQYTAEGDSNDLSCNSYNAPSISEGSSYAFSSWNCTTTFTESGLPSNQYWKVNYGGATNSIISTGSSTQFINNDITTVSQYTAEGDSNDLSCNSYNAPSISEGSSYAFSSWNCTTTFIDDGFTSPLQNLSHQWTIKWNSVRGTSTSSIISFTNTGISNVATEPYQQPFTEGTVLCTGPSGSAYPGSLINLGIENTGSNWICDVIAISMSPNIIKFVPEFYPSNVILDSITVPSSNAFVSQYGMSGQLAYNPNTNEFYVPMPGDGAVALINASTATYLGSISFGSGVVIGTYYQNGLVFVLDSPSPSLHTNYSVLVINGNTPLKTNTTISYTASGFAYNAATNSFWIGSTALGANSIYVVAANSTANLIDIITASFINPQNSGYLTGPAAYDPNNHEMYVSGVTSDIGGAGEIQLFYSNGTAVGSPININSTTSNPGQVVYTPYSVKNTGGTDHIDVVGLAGFPPDSLTIIDDSTNTVTGSIALPSYSAQLFYDGAINSGFAFPGSDLYTFYCPYSSSTGLCDSGSILSSTFANDPGVGDVNLTLSNTGSENVSTLGGVITQPTTITFLESGLPSNIGWAASIAGYSFTSSTSYIIAPVAINGGYSYSFLINPICSGTTLYSSNATRGSASAGQVVKVEWTAKTNGCP